MTAVLPCPGHVWRIDMGIVITFAITAYNCGQYLRRTLSSFLDPKYLPAIEIIVVDDGSTDDTPEIAMEYVRKYPKSFRLIRKENGGWGSAVNTGIKNARGKYFMVVDGDDFIETGELGKVVESLSEKESDLFVLGYYEYYLKTGERILKKPTVRIPAGRVVSLEEKGVWSEEAPSAQDQDEAEYSAEDALRSIYMNIHAMIYRTEMLRKSRIRITRHSFYVDKELNTKVIAKAKNMTFLDRYLYVYCKEVSGQSMSREGFEEHIEEHMAVCLRILRLIRQLPDGKKKEFLNDYAVQCVNRTYGFFLILSPTDLNRRRLYTFDRKLDTEFPDIYARCQIPSWMRAVKAFHFHPYRLLVRYYALRGYEAR